MHLHFSLTSYPPQSEFRCLVHFRFSDLACLPYGRPEDSHDNNEKGVAEISDKANRNVSNESGLAFDAAILNPNP